MIGVIIFFLIITAYNGSRTSPLEGSGYHPEGTLFLKGTTLYFSKSQKALKALNPQRGFELVLLNFLMFFKK